MLNIILPYLSISHRNFEYLSKSGDRMKFDLAQARNEAGYETHINARLNKTNSFNNNQALTSRLH